MSVARKGRLRRPPAGDFSREETALVGCPIEKTVDLYL